MPIISAPAAAQGLAHARGELATAEGMAAAGTIMSQSTYGTTRIKDTAAAGKGAPQFFQLYMSKDWDINKAWLDEAVASGVKAIVVTVDSMLGGYREADIINNFQFPLPMGNMAQLTNDDGTGKGIAEIYAAAAQVILPSDIKRVPIIFDSGVRRGSHVFKALASGADLVAIGRQIFYGLALGGAQGAQTIEDVKKAKLVRR